jgi:hypothetical protein
MKFDRTLEMGDAMEGNGIFFFCILVFSCFFIFFSTLCLSSVTKGQKRICDLGEQEDGRDREKGKRLIKG